LDEIAFLDPQSWTQDLHSRTRWLRQNDPVHWSEPDQCWLITKFDDVAAVSKNQAVFTSAEGVRPDLRIGLIDEPEPHHGQLRGLINKGFTPRMVKKLAEPFGVFVKDAIDAVSAQGHCDFVDAIAVPLPLLVIAEMIGIRPEDRKDFHRWSDHMIAGDGAKDPEVLGRAGAAFVEYSTYVTKIIEARRKEPKDDLVSILVGAEKSGFLRDIGQDEHAQEILSEEHKGLANDELIMTLVILLVAGNETTRNGLSGGMQLLIENPDQRQRILDDPSLLPSAVEEMLRLTSPVHSFQRTVTTDTELRGKQLQAGDRVLLLYGSANRDEEVFDDPESFRADRNPAHVAFGLGTHFCLGANLARMEMRNAFEQILQRMPDAEYAAEGPVFEPSALVRSVSRMEIKFTPGG